MPYLPSELWLHILSYTSNPHHTWRSIRQTNHQLKDCVEKHFADNIIPTIKLELSFGLPCYDARNPLHGKAKFRFSRLGDESADGRSQRVIYCLVDVEPEHYMEQLLVRWHRLKESSGCGSGGNLPGSLEWRMVVSGTAHEDEDRDRSGGMRSGGKEGAVRLKAPVAFSDSEKSVEGSAVGFEWMASLTAFLS